jgi:hypothetical protein
MGNCTSHEQKILPRPAKEPKERDKILDANHLTSLQFSDKFEQKTLKK